MILVMINIKIIYNPENTFGIQLDFSGTHQVVTSCWSLKPLPVSSPGAVLH